MGRTHCAAAAAAGLAWAEFAAHLPLLPAVTLTGLTAGAGVLPDLDHPDGTLAHCYGFLTKAFAYLTGKVSGGHRHLTHSVLGVLIFGAMAWAGVHYRHDLAGRIVLGVLLSLIIAAGLYAVKIKGHLADIAAIGTAVFMAATGTGLSLVALATVTGCCAHIATDMLTDSGCPLAYPFSQRRQKLLPEPLAFTTGTRPESVALAVFLAALGFLAWHAFTPAATGHA